MRSSRLECERVRRRERDLRLVRESVERLRSSDGWRLWLAAMAGDEGAVSVL